MILFFQHIDRFKAANGMNVTPIKCKLLDGTVGYYLSDVWESEIQSKNIVYLKLNISQIVAIDD